MHINGEVNMVRLAITGQQYAVIFTKTRAQTSSIRLSIFGERSLAERYTNLLNERLKIFETVEMLQLPLEEYVKRFTEGVDSFFMEYPGYRATFLEIITAMPEVDEVRDDQLMQTCKRIFLRLNDGLSEEDCEAIAFVMVKAVGNFVWLASGQPPEFRQRLVLEAQRLSLNYLKSYLSR